MTGSDPPPTRPPRPSGAIRVPPTAAPGGAPPPTSGRFLLLFLPFLAVLAAVIVVLYRWGTGNAVAAGTALLEERVELTEDLLEMQVRRLATDTIYLVRRVADAGGLAATELLAQDLGRFGVARGIYEEIRLLDLEGRERLRLRFAGGVARRVPDEELRDRSGRPYFPPCRELGAEEVHLSKLELTAEAGRLIEPYRPVLRVCSPYLDAEGRKAGLVVLNYLTTPLLERWRPDRDDGGDRLLLAADDGTWIVGPEPGLEWGRQRPPVPGARLADWDPELAAALAASEAGAVHTRRGLFGFRRFRVEETDLRILGEVREFSMTGAESWWLLGQMNQSSLIAPAHRWLAVATTLATGLALLVGVVLAQRLRLVAVRAGRAAERAAQLGFFQRVADALPVAVFVRDGEGRISGVNRAGSELLGRSSDELIGRDPAEFFDPEGGAAIQAADFRLRTGEADRVQYELRMTGPDGAPREVTVHRARLSGGGESYPGSVSAVVDLTELHETQRRLARSEERFRALIENSHDVIAILEGERLEYVSPSVEARLGWRPEELVGRSYLDLIHPEDLQRAVEAQRALVERPGISPPVRTRMRHRDGGYRIHEAILSTLLDETIAGRTFVFARDVTEAVEAERRVEEARRVLQAVVEEMPALFLALADDGSTAVWNREAERITGLPAGEVLGRADLWQRLMPEREYRELTLRRLELDRGAFRDLELEIVRPAGERRVISLSSVALRLPIPGWSTWMIGVDVTRRREAESERTRATAALERWTQRLVTLNQMDDLLLACESLEEAYQTATPFLSRLLGAAAGAFYRFDSARDHARAVLGWGGIDPGERTLASRDCWAVRLGRPHGLEAPGASETRCAHVERGFAGRAVCIPAFSGSELQGILHLRLPAGALPAGDVEALRQLAVSIAAHLAIRFSAIGLRDAYRRQSTRDPLTDLFNRRYMEETLARELRRCLRSRESLAVLALDLDHFKSINDEFGHEVGDAVLVAAAQVLGQHSRVSDVACRAGGEEFIVLLPGMPLEGAVARAEAIRRAISHLHERRPEPAFARLTVSIGVALHPEHGVEGPEILRAADQALYRAKRGGRDRVELASPPA